MAGGEKSSLEKRIQMRGVERSINKSAETEKKRQKDYRELIIEYLRDNGQLICISDDAVLVKSLRELIVDTLKMPASSLNANVKPENSAKLCRMAVENKKSPLILFDQNVSGREHSFTAKLLKNAFPEAKILMLASETDKNHLLLMHESGVDACLIKPMDGMALLEKIALAIRPPEQLERSLDWAQNLLKQGDHLRALQVCAQAMEKNFSSPAILLMTGDIYKAMKEYDKAAEAYQKAQSGSGLYLEPLKKLTELYAENGNLGRQLEYLEKMDELSPLNLERKMQIGELALKLNRPDRARKIFDQAVKLSNRQAKENVASVAYRVADIYNEQDPATAALFLQKGLETRREFWSHEDVATFNRLGLLLRRAGKWREAAEEYQKAIAVMPSDDSLHYNLSMAWLDGKEYEAARASALKALGLNPELPRRSARIACNLASVFLKTNDKIHAMPLLRQALESDPENAAAKELLAKAESA